MAGKKATAPTATRALTKWDEKLAAIAADAVKTQSAVGGAGNFISIKAGTLSYQGASAPGNKMRVVIVDSILVNEYYDEPFDQTNPTSPACYAFGRNVGEMRPHEAVESPINARCVGCPNKEFGSADRGKGKACADVQRLALITEGDLEDIENAEIAFLKLPYFSTLEYAGYVRHLFELKGHRPVMAFVTEITVVSDPKAQFKVKFQMVEELEGEDVFAAVFKKHEEAKGKIAFPFPKFDAQAGRPANGRGQQRNAPAPRPAAPAKAAPAKSVAPVAVGARKKERY